MKTVLETSYKTPISLFLVLLFWSSSVLAQRVTNTPAGPPAVMAGTAAEGGTAHVWLTFGLDRVGFLQSTLADIPLWQYLASLIYIFLAFYVPKLLDLFIGLRLRKWAEKTKTEIDDLFIGLVRGPVKLVTFVILLHIGMEMYAWPEFLTEFFSKTLKIIVACSLTYVLLKAIDLFVGVWHQRTAAPENEQFGKQLLPLIRKSLKVFVVVVAALVTSQNLGLNVTGLIASLSIGGLAVGLAAQDTLANLFGAIAVLGDKPFQVGDRIQLDVIDGTVETIGFRSTRVRNLDGHLVTVPNKTMGNATITNISKRPNIKTVMNIGVTYDTPAEQVARAMTIIEEIFKPHPMTADLIISFNRFESSSLNILVVHWWNSTDFKAYLGGIQLLNLEVKRRFDAEGINFAFPTQTLYLKQDADSRLTAPADSGKTSNSPSEPRPKSAT